MSDSTSLIPSNLEAEMAVLGAMLMNETATSAVVEMGVTERFFYRPAHRLVFTAIQAVRAEGSLADELAVIAKLKSMAEDGFEGSALDRVSAQYVMSLAEKVPAVANVKAYAEAVREAWVKRSVLEAAHEVQRAAYDPTVPSGDVVKVAEASLLSIVRDADATRSRGDEATTLQSLERWSAEYDRRSDPEAFNQDTLSWGDEATDERLGRAKQGAVYVPAGWTKHGKTWWVADKAEAFFEQGARGLIACGEMSDSQMMDRWVAMGGFDYTKVQDGTLPWNVIRERVEQIRKWDRKTITGRITVERVRGEVSRAKIEGRPFRFVVIDHLGLMRPDKGQGRHGQTEFLEYVCSEMQSMAEEFGFTLMLVSQLSRPREERGAHPRFLRAPIPTDLKGASGIEQIASAVIFVYRQMNRDTGLFDQQLSWLLFPFHRFRQQPEKMRCEFELPHDGRRSAYRFKHQEMRPASEDPEVIEVQETLGASFAATLVPNDDGAVF